MQSERCENQLLRFQFYSLYINLFVRLQRRLLAIYLHHDGSILSNVFCSQILCADAVVSYLSNHFVLWAWDVTLPKNKAK